MVDFKPEGLHVERGKTLHVFGRDRGVFDALNHACILSPQSAAFVNLDFHFGRLAWFALMLQTERRSTRAITPPAERHTAQWQFGGIASPLVAKSASEVSGNRQMAKNYDAEGGGTAGARLEMR
jgi:hypothetical protein